MDAKTWEFIYEGATPQGQRVKGRFRGDKERFLAESRKKGITLLKVKQKKIGLKRGNLSESDLHTGIEELYHLINSGMKIDQAIHLVIKTCQKEASVILWKSILKEVRAGKQFSMALKEICRELKLDLPEFYVSILSVGEEVGDLGASLSNLNDYLEFNRGLRAEIRSALAYPAFLIMMTILALALIFGLILPNFANIFGPREMEKLPAISRLVFEIGKYFHDNYLTVLTAMVAVGVAVAFAFPLIKRKAISIFSLLPITQRLVLNMDLANVLTSFGIMLNGGIELNRALRQTARVARLPILKALMEQSVDEVKKGRKISDIWSDSRLIPAEVISLATVGESSARLGVIMQELGSRFLNRFKRDVKDMLTWLEPAIILVLGGFVGFIVVAIALALVSINEIVS